MKNKYIEEIKKEFPNFYKYLIEIDEDIELPYMVFSSLGNYIEKVVNEKNIQLVEDIIKYINDKLETEDSYIKDVIVTGTFAEMTNKKEVVEKIKPFLSKKSKELINIVLSEYN